jgi:hypothetical protein
MCKQDKAKRESERESVREERDGTPRDRESDGISQGAFQIRNEYGAEAK